MSITLGLMIIFISILIIDLVMMIFCLINIIKSKEKSKISKIGWGLIVLILNFIGPLLYLILGWEKFNKNII